MGGLDNFPFAGAAVFWLSYAAILAVPGPSFVIVSVAAVSASRRCGLITAMGVASGAATLLVLALGGGALLPRGQELGPAGDAVRAAVLLFVGVKALRRAFQPVARQAPERCGASSRWFLTGALTALTNPISFVFFSSTALAAKGAGDTAILGPTLLPTGVFLMAGTWFGLVAVLLSLPFFRALHGRAARGIDAAMGAALVVLALGPLLA